MFLRLFALFTVTTLVELALLIELGGLIGIMATIGIIVATGALGAFLARREGLKVLSQIQDHMQRGLLPTDQLLEGLMILIAGAVLLTPGLLTDLLGFAMLIAPIRRLIRARIAAYLKKRMTVVHHTGPFRPFSSDTNSVGQSPDYEIVDMPEDD